MYKKNYNNISCGLPITTFVFGPHPSPSTIPAAKATTFFNVPHISTPGTSGCKLT